MADTLIAALTAAGYGIERQWTRDDGDRCILVKPPVVPADLNEVSALITAAGETSVDGYPQWMALRKLALIVLA